jgi:long-chain acyl-CoA synthetase
MRNLRWCAMAYLAEVQPVAPGDAMLHPAPLSHGGGLYHLPYVLNGGVNVVPASGGFDSAEIAALAAHWRNASFFAAPTIVHRLVEWAAAQGGARPIDGLATICYGGGPMYLADIERALATIGPHFAQIYGQGESPMTITVLPRQVILDRDHPRHRQRLASVGHAQVMVEVAVRDSEGQALPPGEPGEVCVRGEVVMKGYWQDPEASAKAIRDGWLHTGDIGSLDADGFLTLLDRSKDLIISGGTNIYPREVEEALLAHPAVAEASVVGAPDPEWGEVVVAWVVLRAPAAEAELDAHCLGRIALQATEALALRRCAAEEQLRQGAEDRTAGTRAGLTSPLGWPAARTGPLRWLSRRAGPGRRVCARARASPPPDRRSRAGRS